MKECWINVYEGLSINRTRFWYTKELAEEDSSKMGYKPLYRIHIKMKDAPNVPMSDKSLYDRYRAY